MLEFLKRNKEKSSGNTEAVPAGKKRVRVPQLTLHFDKLSTLEFTSRFPLEENDPAVPFKDFLNWFQGETTTSFFLRHSEGGTLLIRSTIRMCDIRWVNTLIDVKEWDDYKAAKHKVEQGVKDES